MQPLVSVICVCYNHKAFLLEALNSVKGQTYQNIEIIIIDDGSIDGSQEKFYHWINQNQISNFIDLKTNHGYCKAFNIALAEAKGEFIIDFATDDVMPPSKIEEQIEFFSKQDKSVGVVFTDADYIDQDGQFIRSHFSYLLEKNLIKEIPTGDVYADVLSRYFIPSPTMMSRAEVFKSLNGYDEQLAYEDFDFWVRSSRNFEYAYLPKKLMKIRRNINSMSTGWYKKGDPQLYSTYLVCLKALDLNRNELENSALIKRVQYEFRQSVFSENFSEAKLFYNLLQKINGVDLAHQIVFVLNNYQLPLAGLRKLYHKVRY